MHALQRCMYEGYLVFYYPICIFSGEQARLSKERANNPEEDAVLGKNRDAI